MDREQPHGIPSPASTHAVDPRQSQSSHSSPQMSSFAKAEAGVAMAPEPATRASGLTTSTGYTPCYAREEDRFEPSSHPTEGIQTAYMSPQSQASCAWTSSVLATAGSEDYEHYALHSSPAAAALGYPTQGCSNQSSPRSWGSPDQFRSVPWEPATEPLQSQYSRHSQQQPIGGFSMREGLDYARSSQPVLPSTSFPAPSAYLPSHSYESTAHGFPPQEHVDVYHQSPYPLEGLSNVPDARPLSPCSSTLGYVKLEDEVASPAPASEGGHDTIHGVYNHGVKSHSRQSSSVPSTPGNSSNTKVEEPYAQLIFRAFKSNPRHAMTLQDLYQWFRENTDKGKNDTKGWQNSIRHNLSMNRAFTKRERKSISGEDDGEDAATADPNNLDSKKATEWFLEPWALQDGVQSTTRYRKDNTGRRNGGNHRSAGAPSRKKHSTHHITSNGSGRIRSRHHLQSSSSGLHSMHYTTRHLSSLHHPHPNHGRPALILPSFGSTTSYLGYQHHHEPSQQLQPAMFPSEPYRPLYSTQAHSESGVDEPVTPEASYPDGLALPDLQGRATSSSDNNAQAVAAAYYGAAGEGTIGGVDMAGYTYPSAAAAPVVNVYDEVVDRYGGWVGGVEETTSATGYHGHHGQGSY